MQTVPPSPMTILIVHYHLRAGGVTRVIEAQARALQMLGHEVVIASSGPSAGWEARMIKIPELDYRREGDVPLEQLFAVKADQWIIHNPTLGLNAGYPAMIAATSQSGIPLLLQIHDFVEDGRPANYQLVKDLTRLYPVASHIHYATINRRDLGILVKAGLPQEQCHYLPNAIDPPKLGNSTQEENLVFYPVRGIRRKNLGELCLLAAHAPPGTSFAVALRSSSEEPAFIHDDWVDFARRLKLPVAFDVVSDEPDSFLDWLGRASHLVTTSISEGFGLTFLDPAFLGKPLIGRDLPEVTRDITSIGTLYQTLPVPISSLPDLERLYRKELNAAMAAYGRELSDDEIDDAWREFSSTGEVDFGNLPENLQRHVIESVKLPWLSEWLAAALKEPAQNIDITPWSLDTYRERLSGIIDAKNEAGPVTWIDPKQVLDQFVDPGRFHFLRAPL